MPRITDLGFSRRAGSLEELGFSRTHRRDGETEVFADDTFSTPITDQIVQVDQNFPDLAFGDDKIETLTVNKLRAGTITSQKMNLEVLADAGDVWIAAGKTDFNDTTNGFILGIDDSDSDKVKFVIGDASSGMDWNETTADTLTINGTINADSGTIGGWTITSGYIYSLASGTPTSSPNDGLVMASGNEAIIVYENTEKRVEVGYLSSGVYGIRGYANDGSTVLFELSDTQLFVAGFTPSATTLANSTDIILDAANKKISINDATFANQGIQLDYNSGTPRAYVGDGSDQFLNFNGTTLTVNNSLLGFESLYGDGSDGDVVISGNTTLTEDMFYDDLTIDATYTLNTGGFRVHVKGTLTVNGTIGRVGSAGGVGDNGSLGGSATGGTAGAALASGSVEGAIAGEAGANGAGGVAVNNTAGTIGVASGAGTAVAKSLTGTAGTDGGKCGGANNGFAGTIGQATNGSGASRAGGNSVAAGSGASTTGTVFNKPNTAFGAWLLQDFFPSQDSLRSSASSTGGAGGASGGNQRSTGSNQSPSGGAGGGSGSPGGIVAIYAKKIVVGASGVMTAAGGAGGNGGTTVTSTITGVGATGGSSGGGGGAGGAGGALLLVYSVLTNSGTIAAAGGAAGSGGAGGTGAGFGGLEATNWGYWDGATGADGAAGGAGVVTQLIV